MRSQLGLREEFMQQIKDKNDSKIVLSQTITANFVQTHYKYGKMKKT
jgi:hypothetical protein